MEEEKEFIQSGILELYVIGDVSPEEQRVVEKLKLNNPIIAAEISAIERTMELYAAHNAVQIPNPDKKIIDRILPAQPVSTGAADQSVKIKRLYFALAACVALLIISTLALYSAHNELGDARQQIFALSQDKEQYTRNASFMTQQNEELKMMADMPADPNWKTVQLAGTKMDPKATMVLYWHTSGQHVMVDSKKLGLPANDETHQYQLWALVNGKPVDLGVFDAKADTTHILMKMKEIAGAQAFAVTLEKRGGAVNPTMDQMIAMGTVNI